MIKVLFESSIFLHQKVGGVSKYISELNKTFVKHKVSSTILAPITINHYLVNKKNSIHFFKIKKIPKFCRKFFFLLNDLFTFIYIHFNKPDILHFSYYNKSLIKFLNIPYVVTVYDLIHEKMNFDQNQFDKKELLQNASHIICISEETKKDLIKIYKINQKKITVIYLGVANVKFKKIKKKDKYILHVGSRTRYKNFDNLIKAFSKSEYLVKNYKIICFGGGSFNNYETKIFEKLKITDCIKYRKGDDIQLSNLYKKASLYVSLSMHEGFGLTLLEAMKLKCPVLCSDILVFKEIYKKSCAYVNAQNINSIKNGIENVLKSRDKQKKLILNSNQIITKLTLDNCALKTIKVYKKILNQ